jgi:hypothetical protein
MKTQRKIKRSRSNKRTKKNLKRVSRRTKRVSRRRKRNRNKKGGKSVTTCQGRGPIGCFKKRPFCKYQYLKRKCDWSENATKAIAKTGLEDSTDYIEATARHMLWLKYPKAKEDMEEELMMARIPNNDLYDYPNSRFNPSNKGQSRPLYTGLDAPSRFVGYPSVNTLEIKLRPEHEVIKNKYKKMLNDMYRIKTIPPPPTAPGYDVKETVLKTIKKGPPEQDVQSWRFPQSWHKRQQVMQRRRVPPLKIGQFVG